MQIEDKQKPPVSIEATTEPFLNCKFYSSSLTSRPNNFNKFLSDQKPSLVVTVVFFVVVAFSFIVGPGSKAIPTYYILLITLVENGVMSVLLLPCLGSFL